MSTNTTAQAGIHAASGSNSSLRPFSQMRIGMTIEEAADFTGIGRNTLRQLVSWEKIPVLWIGRKAIVRTDALEHFMEINQGHNLLEREQVLPV